MARLPSRSWWQPALVATPLLTFLTWGLLPAAAPADPVHKKTDAPLPTAFDKAVPENVDDLKAIQAHVKKLVDKVMPSVVNVRIGQGQGSGIIISEDGYVLTAGHVSGTPGRDAVLTFPDGKKVKGKTLGYNRGIDSGLVKITDEGKYPFVDMGKSGQLKNGDWCFALGHPGGYKEGRMPPLRLGRVLDHGSAIIRTDCTLVGGDSGGPLFDMYGRVVGIHSKINGPVTANIHVPVDTYRDTWDRLVKAESWNGGAEPTPYLGVKRDLEAKDCRLAGVEPGSAAEKAGLKADDVITAVNGKAVGSFADLAALISNRRVGEVVTLDVRRGEEKLTLKATLGKAPQG